MIFLAQLSESLEDGASLIVAVTILFLHLFMLGGTSLLMTFRVLVRRKLVQFPLAFRGNTGVGLYVTIENTTAVLHASHSFSSGSKVFKGVSQIHIMILNARFDIWISSLD